MLKQENRMTFQCDLLYFDLDDDSMEWGKRQLEVCGVFENFLYDSCKFFLLISC